MSCSGTYVDSFDHLCCSMQLCVYVRNPVKISGRRTRIEGATFRRYSNWFLVETQDSLSCHTLQCAGTDAYRLYIRTHSGRNFAADICCFRPERCLYPTFRGNNNGPKITVKERLKGWGGDQWPAYKPSNSNARALSLWGLNATENQKKKRPVI